MTTWPDVPMWTRRLAWGSWVVTFVLTLVSAYLIVSDAAAVGGEDPESTTSEIFGVVTALAFATVGALVASRRPRNAIGWALCAVGFATQFENFGGMYATYGLEVSPGSVPGPAVVASIADAMWIPSIAVLVGFVALLFPDGRLLTPRWRPVIGAIVVAAALSVPLTLFKPGPLYYAEEVANPLGIPALGAVFGVAMGATAVVMGVAILLGLFSLGIRARAARGDERQQLKWLFGSFIVVFVSVPITNAFDSGPISVLFEAMVMGIPIAIGIAILRYRLYDIDVIINRTLVYGALTAALLLSYLAIVVTLSRILDPVTQDSDIAVAASTLVVAALFRPLRGRIQAFIDRRFYRSKYDAARALAAFNARLRDEIDADVVRSDVLGVVRSTLHPVHASLWIKTGEAR